MLPPREVWYSSGNGCCTTDSKQPRRPQCVHFYIYISFIFIGKAEWAQQQKIKEIEWRIAFAVEVVVFFLLSFLSSCMGYFFKRHRGRKKKKKARGEMKPSKSNNKRRKRKKKKEKKRKIHSAPVMVSLTMFGLLRLTSQRNSSKKTNKNNNKKFWFCLQ